MAGLVDKAKNFVADKIANVPKPDASLTDVDFKKVSFDSADYIAKVSVNNPYPHPLPVCEVKYTLKSAGRVIASGNMPDPGSIKSSGTTVLEVPVKDWDIDYELDLGLIIDLPLVGNLTIPLSRKGEIKLPTLSEAIWGSKDEASKETKKEIPKEATK
ncbi:desiccation protectant protein Lea14 homolog [Prunus yedoensis var. nudiflora]|uniref:Desiccation protectant protein Lea14 homolog n=1 Tax=Prunus yedoensis var. nudiflora TaxID=2094558 RepID=A0A314UQM9_PRUYE|nr:desiccation protectant protein Lea14 homolog [Prunus yedoensis var. nudiflora]